MVAAHSANLSGHCYTGYTEGAFSSLLIMFLLPIPNRMIHPHTSRPAHESETVLLRFPTPCGRNLHQFVEIAESQITGNPSPRLMVRFSTMYAPLFLILRGSKSDVYITIAF